MNKQLKLVLYTNKKIIIKNFHDLIDVSRENIEIDDYIISGEFLIISQMEEGVLTIEGTIKEIKVIC